MLDYPHLEALRACVEQGSFRRAARHLRLTQSAVSQRILQLEDRLGAPVLIRSSPPKPTPLGQRLIDHLRQVEGLEQELFSDHEHAVSPTRLVIGVNADSLATWLLPALQTFLDARRVLVDLIVENEEYGRRLLQEGAVFACISSTQDPLAGCEAELLGTVRYRCAARRSFIKRYFPRGLTPEAVREAPTVLFNAQDILHERFLHEKLGLRDIHYPYHCVPTSEGFLEMIRRGLAYGMVPELHAERDLRAKRIVDLAPKAYLSVKLYWHYHRRETRLQQELRELLIRGARKVLREAAEG